MPGYVLALQGLMVAMALAFDWRLVDTFELPKAVVLRTGALLVLWLFCRRQGAPARRQWRLGGLDWPVLAYVLAAAVSSVLSVHAHTSFFGQYRFYFSGFWSAASAACLYFVVSRSWGRFGLERWQKTLLWAGAGVVLYAALQKSGWDPVLGHLGTQNRPISSLGSSVYLGHFLAMLLPLAASRLLLLRALGSRLLMGCFFLLTWYLLLGAHSRGAWLGALMALSVWVVLHRADLFRMKRLFACAVLAAGALGTFGLGTLGPQSLRERMGVFLDPGEDSAATRLELWGMALRMMREHPFGTGPDTFGLVSPAYETLEFRRGAGTRRLATNAHNEALQAGVTMGAPGLAAYLWLHAMLGISLWRRWRNCAVEEKPLWSGLLCSSLALWIPAQFNFHSLSTLTCFWTLMGVAAQRAPEPRPETRGGWAPRGHWLVPALLLASLLHASTVYRADRWHAKAQISMGRKDYAAAYDYAYRAWRLNPWGEGYALLLGNAGYEKGVRQPAGEAGTRCLEEASGVYLDYLRRHPLDANARHHYAVSLLWRARSGQDALVARAIQEEGRALELAPLFPHLWHYLGEFLHFSGDVRAAKKAWVRALEIDPFQEKTRLWLEKYAPRGVFDIYPRRIQVRQIPLGKRFPLSAEREEPLRIINAGSKTLSFRIEPFPLSRALYRIPGGYEPLPRQARVEVSLREAKVSSNQIRLVDVAVEFPAERRYAGRKYFGLIRVRCLDFDVPAELFLELLLETKPGGSLWRSMG